MQDIQQRWRRYRAYGARRGLKSESAEEFAQEAYIRFMKAGKEINLSYVFADYARATRARPGTHKAAAIHVPLFDNEPIAPDVWDVRESVERVLEESDKRGIPRRKTMKKVAKYFGITVSDLRALLF